MKSYGVTIQMKRLRQNVGVVLVICLDFPKSNINILVIFSLAAPLCVIGLKSTQPKFFFDTLQFLKPSEAKTESIGC